MTLPLPFGATSMTTLSRSIPFPYKLGHRSLPAPALLHPSENARWLPMPRSPILV